MSKLVGVEQKCGSARNVYRGIGMDCERLCLTEGE